MRTRVERSAGIAVRQVRDDDSTDPIELIGGCYAAPRREPSMEYHFVKPLATKSGRRRF
jgi:hypothetical protein